MMNTVRKSENLLPFPVLSYVDEEMRNRLQVRLITRTLAFHVG